MKGPISIVLVIVLAGCGSPPTTEADPGLSAQDEAAIRSVIADWGTAAAMNDWEAAATHYADDYFEAVAAVVDGPDAALERANGFAITYSAMSQTVRRIEGSGDLAYAWVGFESRYTNAQGRSGTQTGNSLWVLRRESDGQWLLVGSAFGSAFQPDAAG